MRLSIQQKLWHFSIDYWICQIYMEVWNTLYTYTSMGTPFLHLLNVCAVWMVALIHIAKIPLSELIKFWHSPERILIVTGINKIQKIILDNRVSANVFVPEEPFWKRTRIVPENWKCIRHDEGAVITLWKKLIETTSYFLVPIIIFNLKIAYWFEN